MFDTNRNLVARELMDDFARSTGLSSGEAPRRYLWTDAFAVCNYLGLHVSSGEARFRDLALLLVEQVHHVLGRHRDDDPQRGWISGLSEDEGARHPTAGGLRIGKRLPERRSGEPHDQGKEWDRDGQYYHYLTKWIHALTAVWKVTGEEPYYRWAMELAAAAHRGFVFFDGNRKRIHWKMSIDLSRPQVPSVGHHDALDGFLVLSALKVVGPSGAEAGLDQEVRELAEMCQDQSWTTDDPLGVGGLLVLAYRCAQLTAGRHLGSEGLLQRLVKDSESSLRALGNFSFLRWPAQHRLAFRELGLSIGFAAVDRMDQEIRNPSRGHFSPALLSTVPLLQRYRFARDEIDKFWMDPLHRNSETWTAHRAISQVMLATSLAPQGFLET